jgi:hypothetical protein
VELGDTVMVTGAGAGAAGPGPTAPQEVQSKPSSNKVQNNASRKNSLDRLAHRP